MIHSFSVFRISHRYSLPPNPASHPVVGASAPIAGVPVPPDPEEVGDGEPPESGEEDQVGGEEEAHEAAERHHHEPQSGGEGLQAPVEGHVQRGELDAQDLHGWKRVG